MQKQKVRKNTTEKVRPRKLEQTHEWQKKRVRKKYNRKSTPQKGKMMENCMIFF